MAQLERPPPSKAAGIHKRHLEAPPHWLCQQGSDFPLKERKKSHHQYLRKRKGNAIDALDNRVRPLALESADFVMIPPILNESSHSKYIYIYNTVSLSYEGKAIRY